MAATAAPQQRSRPYNFSAGPGALPEELLLHVAAQLADFEGTGLSIMEMSHRDAGGPVQRMIQDATFAVRTILEVPASYDIIWQQGGAHGQFAAVPLNLLGERRSADYVDTGVWSQKAMAEASKYCEVRIAAATEASCHSEIPPVESWDLSEDSAYVHICANDTIYGLEFLQDPDVGDKLLVADFTSTLLSRRVNFDRYAAIYCSAGKNLGTAGVCLVVVRKDLLGRARANTPCILDWTAYSQTAPVPSLLNTPPVFPLYICLEVLRHLLEQWGTSGTGALAALESRAEARARRLYREVDESGGFYTNHVSDANRSRVTICFRFGADAGMLREWDGSITSIAQPTQLEARFLAEAQDRGLLQLGGHPAFGGIRVCLYNAVPDAAVDELVCFMRAFREARADARGLAAKAGLVADGGASEAPTELAPSASSPSLAECSSGPSTPR
mmetsp:Transcript_92941/g.262965  ORF Transcript_92941/g.262965 Transcript_92941/m.262965 type:complete len:444 (-) Transcript_92941:111-1442(-)